MVGANARSATLACLAGAYRRAAVCLAQALLMLLAAATVGEARAEVGAAARISSDVATGKAPLAVRFSLLAETRPAGRIAKVEVDPGDGGAVIVAHTGRGWVRPTPRHTYASTGRFTARIRLTTTDGRSIVSRTRIAVAPAQPADPAELLAVAPAAGDAPLGVRFDIGGRTLPFTAKRARLNFGDGRSQWVTPLTRVRHTYGAAGVFGAKLEIRGEHGNRAFAFRIVRVAERPRIRFTVAPAGGVAPVEATVLASIPSGDIKRARVIGPGGTIFSTGDIVGGAVGRRKLTLTETGTYRFLLQAETKTGRRFAEERKVVVRAENLAEGVTYFEHDGGVTQIVQQGGAFEGIMRAPTVEQAVAGYDIGMTFVRGAFADRSYSALRPIDYDDPASPRRRSYEDFAAQTAGGSYLILKGECPPQWGEYRFSVDFGDEDRPAQVDGTVMYRNFVTRAERAANDLDEPLPRPGIIGRIRWVEQMIALMRRAGDDSGRPDACVQGREPNASRPAVFRRITEEEAQKIARRNLRSVRAFAGHAYDGVIAPRPDAEPPRNADPLYGDPPRSTDPVFLATGEFYETSTDLAAPAPWGLGWRFQRTYRSQSPDRTSLGRGWTHNYHLALARSADGWMLRDENGAVSTFAPAAGRSGVFVAASGARLVVDDSLRMLRRPDGLIYRFRPTLGFPDRSDLMAVETPAGAVLTLEYDLLGRIVRVVDPSGRAARYAYDDDRGYLVRVTAPDGTAIGLTHDADGNLVRVERFDPGAELAAHTVRYGYFRWSEGAPAALRGNMTEIRLPRGGDGKDGVIELVYGEDPGAIAFDRAIRQRTGRLEERFAYAWRGAGEDRRFVTTLTAEGRAAEEHVFTADGRHESTAYLLASDAPPILTRFLYDDRGRPAGRILASNERITVSPGPGQGRHTISRMPAPSPPGADASEDVRPMHWVVEREPLFGHDRAVWGPFVGAAPQDAAALSAAPSVVRDFDYEEAGAQGWAPFARFALAGSAPARGDLNGDGRTDQAMGRAVRVTARRGDRTTTTLLRWNDAGALVERVAADGVVRRFSYDAGGALSEVVDAAPGRAPRRRARYDWDANGALLGGQLGDGPYVGVERSAAGRIVRMLGEDGTDRRFVWDAAGRLLEERDGADRLLVQYLYDAFGNLVQRVRFPEAGTQLTETYAYDAFGRVTAAEDGAGRWSRELDPLGRTVVEHRADGSAARFAYDIMGRLIDESGPGWRHRHDYDGFGRLIRTEMADGARLSWRRDGQGRPMAREIRAADGTLVSRIAIQSAAGADGPVLLLGGAGAARIEAPVRRAAAYGTTPQRIAGTAVRRDRLGRPVAFRDRAGTLWAARRDGAGRIVAILRDDVALMQAAYGPAGATADLRLFGFAPQAFTFEDLTETIVDGRGARRVQARDGYGRLTEERAEFGAIKAIRALGRDAAGRLTDVTSGGIRWTRRFESDLPIEDRLILADGANYGISRRFDAQGRLSRRSLPSGADMTFSYPEENHVRIQLSGESLDLAYGADGALKTVTRGDVAVRYEHPVLGAPRTAFLAQVLRGEQAVFERRLDIAAGRVVAVALNGQTGAIARDAAGRVTTAQVPGLDDRPIAYRYRYAATGARLPDVGDRPWLPTHAGEPRLAELDADGRVAAVDGLTLTRDPWGRVETATRDGAATRFRRDGMGRVVRILHDGAPATDIVYDRGVVTGIYGGSDGDVEYVLDPGGLPIARLARGRLVLLALDFGGGPVAAIDASGRVEQIAVGPFGAPAVAPPGPRPRLDGMLYDPGSRLYLTPLRAMSPALGQFLAPEPYGPMASPEPYAYGFGDPFSFRDPTGAQSVGSPPDADTETSRNYFRQLADGYERGAERIEDDVTGAISPDRAAADAAGGQTDRSASGGGANSESADAGGAGRPYGGGARPDTETERAERRRASEASGRLNARIAEREAQERAAAAAFKRNVNHARRLLPEEVERNWLELDGDDNARFEPVWEGEPVPWGTPATGPVSGSPGDPHGLLRAALVGDEASAGRRGDRLRFIFRDQLAVPPPAPPPAQQEHTNAGRPRPPSSFSRMLTGGSGNAEPGPPAPTPEPGEPRRPGGVAGGLF